MAADCYTETIGLLLLSLALLISMCVNIVVCLGRRTTLGRNLGSCCSAHLYEGEGPSEDEGHYFHGLNHHELQENPHNHHEQQENPIYGNIHTNRRVESCHNMMTKQQTRDLSKPLETDLNYASLNLKLAKKRKKHRHQQAQAQGRNNQEDQLPIPFTPSDNAFLEVEGDMDAHLPPRDNSTMVSHSSIYLNSQQIAQEAEEMDRERSINMDIGWEGTRRQDDWDNREWKGEQENEESKDDSNGTVCTRLSDVQAIHSGTDHFISSLSHEGDQ